MTVSLKSAPLHQMAQTLLCTTDTRLSSARLETQTGLHQEPAATDVPRHIPVRYPCDKLYIHGWVSKNGLGEHRKRGEIAILRAITGCSLEGESPFCSNTLVPTWTVAMEKRAAVEKKNKREKEYALEVSAGEPLGARTRGPINEIKTLVSAIRANLQMRKALSLIEDKKCSTSPSPTKRPRFPSSRRGKSRDIAFADCRVRCSQAEKILLSPDASGGHGCFARRISSSSLNLHDVPRGVDGTAS